MREISLRTGYARNTVRAILRTSGLRTPRVRARASRLEAYREYLRLRHAETGLSAVRLLQEIRFQGYAGGIHMVRRFVEQAEGVNKPKGSEQAEGVRASYVNFPIF